MAAEQPKVFVFDLDDTIIRTGDLRNWGSATIAQIAQKAVPSIIEVLDKLNAARRAGRPVKIFLLTNNNALDYISRVERWLASEFATEENSGASFFDDKLWFGAPGRDGGKKRIEDVALLAKEPVSDSLKSRTWFFDDLDNHVLMDQLPEGHYIVVNPDGETPGIPDIDALTAAPAAGAAAAAGAVSEATGKGKTPGEMEGGARPRARAQPRRGYRAGGTRRRRGKKVGRTRRRR